MATAKKSMSPKRKGKKQYTLLHFEIEGFEGEFTAPPVQGVMGRPRVITALQGGDFGPALEILADYDKPTSEVFADMDDEEQQLFFEAWSKASGVEDMGKSQESSNS